MKRKYIVGSKPILVVVSRETEYLLLSQLNGVGIFPEVHCYRPEFVEGEVELHLAEASYFGMQDVVGFIQLCKAHFEAIKKQESEKVC